ncbi:unnamed protein product, partial [Rotaria sp. Silwood2]
VITTKDHEVNLPFHEASIEESTLKHIDVLELDLEYEEIETI